MTDSQLMTELSENLKTQEALRLELGSSLTGLLDSLDSSEKMAEQALENSTKLSMTLSDVQKDFEDFQTRLGEQERQAQNARTSLQSTTDSLTDLSHSLTSYYEDTEAQLKGLKTQNIIWMVLTVAASAVAVAALVID